MVNWTSMIITGSVVFFLAIVGGIIWYGMTKAKWKYNFLLTTRDGKNGRLVKAKIIQDADNPKIRKFAFKDSDNTLMIQEPNGSFEGKPVRKITYNSEGKYVYLKGYSVDEKDYLSISLKPEARELALYQYQANQRRNPVMDKLQLATLVTGIILFIIILGSIIFMSVKFYKASDNIVEVSKSVQLSTDNLLKSMEVRKQGDEIILAASNNLASYCTGLKVEGNLTRSLNPQSIE